MLQVSFVFIFISIILTGCMPDSMTKFKVAKPAPEPIVASVAGPSSCLYNETTLYLTTGTAVSGLTPTVDVTDGVIFSADDGPNGVVLDSSTGAISGTPTTAGSFVFDITASRGGDTVSCDLSQAYVFDPIAGFHYQNSATTDNYLSMKVILTLSSVTSFSAGEIVVQEKVTGDGNLFTKGVVNSVDTEGKRLFVTMTSAPYRSFISGSRVDDRLSTSSQTFLTPEATITEIENVFETNTAITIYPDFTAGNTPSGFLDFSATPALPDGLDFASDGSGQITGTVTDAYPKTTHTITVTNSETGDTADYDITLSFVTAPDFLSLSNRFLITLKDNTEFTYGKYISNSSGDAIGRIVKQLGDGNRVVVEMIRGASDSSSYAHFAPGDNVGSEYQYINSDQTTTIVATDEYSDYSVVNSSVIPINHVVEVDDNDSFEDGGDFLYDDSSPFALYYVAHSSTTDNYVYLINQVTGSYLGTIADGSTNITGSADGFTVGRTVINIDSPAMILTGSTDRSGLASFKTGLEITNSVGAVGDLMLISGTNHYLSIKNPGFENSGIFLAEVLRGKTTTVAATITDNYIANFYPDNYFNSTYMYVTGMPGHADSGESYSVSSYSGLTGTFTFAPAHTLSGNASYRLTVENSATTLQPENTFYLNRNQTVLIAAYLNEGDNVTFQLDKALPAGLTLDKTTGIIKGTPTDEKAKTLYTMSAFNSLGSASYSFYIQVDNVFEVTTDLTDSTSIVLHKEGRGNKINSCLITKEFITNNAYKPSGEKACFIDIGEMDLYVNGLNLGLSSSNGLCNYVRIVPFFFFSYPYVSTSRPAITETVCPAECDLATGIDPSCTNIPPVGDSCDGDYSDTGGPNCDEGSYTVTTTTWTYDSTSGTCSSDGGADPVTTECSGTRLNCLQGAGSGTMGFTPTIPSRPDLGVTANSISGYSNTWSFSSPINEVHFTSLALSNFVVPDYGSTNQCIESGKYQFFHRGWAEYAKGATGSTAYTTAYSGTRFLHPFEGGNPFYRFECLDPAFNVKARIIVYAREWDNEFSPLDNIDYVDPDADVTTDTTQYLMSTRTASDAYGYINQVMNWNDKILATIATPPAGFVDIFFDGPTNSCTERTAPTATTDFDFIQDQL